MAADRSIEFDFDRIDALIVEEEAALEPKHEASVAYRTVAERYVAGGVASSWQDSRPHAIFIDHGRGNRIYDIDGNEYLDFHLGYGAMVVGHAHPLIVDAIEKAARLGTHFAQPTQDLDVIGENLADRFKLPLWRFANSGTETTLEAIRLLRAHTGRDPRVRGRDRGVRCRTRCDLPGEGDRRWDAVRRDRRDPGALPARHRGRVRHGRHLQRQPAHDVGDAHDPHGSAHARGLRTVQPGRQGDEGRADLRRRALPAPVLRDGRRGEGIRDLFEAAGPGVPRCGRHRRADQLPRVAVPAEPRRVQVSLDHAGDVDALGLPHGG